MRLDWIEEPFAMGPAYSELKRRTRLRVSAGEIFWGDSRFARIRPSIASGLGERQASVSKAACCC